MNTINNQKGFTLLEILVSVGIIATLSAAVSPTVFQHVKESRITRAQSDAAVIGAAVSRFRGDMDEWPVYTDGGTRTHGAIGILYGDSGEWPRIALDSDATCDTDGDGIVEASADDVDDVGDALAFPTSPGDIDWNGNGIPDIGSELSIANCESIAANTNMYRGWVPFRVDTDADGVLAVSDGCTSLLADITDELASIASLGSQLIANVPTEARKSDIAGTTNAYFTDGGAPATLISMVGDNAACSETPVVSIDPAKQYPFKGDDPASSGWNGPYLEEIPQDPWGNKFLVNIHFATAEHDSVEGHENNLIKVVSAGPNGLLETPVGLADIAAPGSAVSTEAGGDDIVNVFLHSMRTTM